MISIDTNILLRYLLRDEKTQAALASKLIDGKQKVLVTDIVLIETIWTLKGKRYNLDKDDILNVIRALFKNSNIEFENGQAVWIAFNLYKKSQTIKAGTKKKDLDFTDALILEKSRATINSEGQSFNGLYSFDKAAQQLKGIKEPR